MTAAVQTQGAFCWRQWLYERQIWLASPFYWVHECTYLLCVTLKQRWSRSGFGLNSSVSGVLVSCRRYQLFSKMYVTVAESGVPPAVRKLDSTKWCLCFRGLHYISSWSLLNVGLRFEREVLVCSVGEALIVSQIAAQGKVSRLFLLIRLCNNSKKCVLRRNNCTVQRTSGSKVNF